MGSCAEEGDIVDAKEWLSQYRGLNPEIDSKREQVRQLQSRRDKYLSLVKGLSDMPRGSGGADWTDIVAELTDALAELRVLVSEHLKMQQEIMRQINSIPNPQQRFILDCRYIQGWTWTKISVQLSVDRSTVWRIHGRALEHIHPPEEVKT